MIELLHSLENIWYNRIALLKDSRESIDALNRFVNIDEGCVKQASDLERLLLLAESLAGRKVLDRRERMAPDLRYLLESDVDMCLYLIA